MPTSNNSIKFFYGDSSLYPPQSVDNDALYLIKNSGVYAGSNIIIDKSLFPINDSNTFLVKLYCSSSGNFEMDATGAELNDAINTNKTIIGEFDYSTIGNLQDQDIDVGGQSAPNGILLCNISYYNQIEVGGSIKVYNIKLYNERCKFNISLNERTNVVSITGEIADQWSTSDHDHDTRYNGIWSSGNYSNTSAYVVKTAAATAAKTVTVTGWRANNGNMLELKFINGNTAVNPTLKINTGTAYPIWYNTSATIDSTLIQAGDRVTLVLWSEKLHIISISSAIGRIKAQEETTNGGTVLFAHGTDYQYPKYSSNLTVTDDGVLDAKGLSVRGTSLDQLYAANSHSHTNASMGQAFGACSTAAATAAKTVSIDGFQLVEGAIVSIKFSNTNTVASPTLNISNTGAKAIYYNNAAIDERNANKLHSGVMTFMYDGTNYYIIAEYDTDTDANVSVTSTTTDSAYPVLFKYSANNTNETNSIRCDSTGTTNFNYNPSTNTLTATNISSTSISASEITLQGESIASDFAKLASPAFTGTPTAPTAAAGTNDTQIATTEFVTTEISNNTLKYTVKAVSSNAVSFTSSSKMLSNTVYVCGTVNANTNMLTFELVNSLSIASGSLDSDIGIMWSPRQAAITNSKVVPTYQIVFRCGSSGASITLPSNIVWRDGSAPAASDLVNKWCELTIMNDIATIIII